MVSSVGTTLAIDTTALMLMLKWNHITIYSENHFEGMVSLDR